MPGLRSKETLSMRGLVVYVILVVLAIVYVCLTGPFANNILQTTAEELGPVGGSNRRLDFA